MGDCSKKTVVIHGVELGIEEAFKEHQGIVYMVCNQYRATAFMARMENEDLIAIGNIGLWKALEGFDDTLGYRFSTYANSTIRGTILRSIQRENLGAYYPRKTKTLGWKILRKELEGKPVEEIAEILEEKKEKIVESLLFIANRDPARLDGPPLYNGTSEGMNLQDMIAGVQEDDSDIRFKEFFESLKGKDRAIIESRMNGLSQYQIADNLGVTQSHISRRLKKLLEEYKHGEESNVEERACG